MKHKNIAIFIPHAGCPHKCSFCDQNAITSQENLPRGEDVTRICTQAFSEITDLHETEIAFFGGSFTAIPRGYMLELLTAAKPFAMQCKGIRISTRPDCIDRRILAVLKEYRVSSIELGAQSLDDAVLAANERGHTAQDVYDASRLIREYGFELGLQIMPGLYGASISSDMETRESVLALHPDTIRIYPVVILKGTHLGELYETGEYAPLPFDRMVEQIAYTMEDCMDAGIRILKVGLHASEFVQEKAIGGYYHPAFRELCESVIYRNRMETAVGDAAGFFPGNGRYQMEVWAEEHTFAVHPSCVSKAVGQKRSNIRFFKEYYGTDIRIIGDGSVPPFQVQIRE